LWAQLAGRQTAGNKRDSLGIVTGSIGYLDPKPNILEYGANDERKVTHWDCLLINE
jgi:hypothetical protein